MATDADQRLLTAEEFLRIDFGSDIKAELDRGILRMMAGGSGEHGRIQGNIFAYLRTALRGSGCRPYGSDMAVRTHDSSVRYPDVSVYCGKSDRASDQLKAFDDPRVVVEILSPSTKREDYGVKLDEYRALASVDTVAFIDPASERLRVIQRVSATGWSDETHLVPVDLHLPALGITIPHAEIFARD